MKLNQSSIVLKTRQKTKCLKVTGLAKGDFISTWSTDNWSIADVSLVQMEPVTLPPVKLQAKPVFTYT